MGDNNNIYEKYTNPKLKNLSPYTVSKEDGIKIRLDANENYADIPEWLKDKVIENIRGINFNRYPDVMAEKLVKKYSAVIGVEKNKIVCGNGSDELINIIMNSFLSKGDKAIAFTPDFSMYSFYGGIIEADIFNIEKDNKDFSVDLDKILELVKREDIKLVIFSNPCNPSGQLIEKAVLENFLCGCPCLVVIDEAYMDFSNESEKNTLCREEYFDKYPNLIVLKTMSKAYGLASLRLGFMLSSQYYVDIIKATKSPYNVNSLSQAAGEAILSEPEFLKERIAELKRGKAELQDRLLSLLNDNTRFKVYATQTNFIYIKTAEAKEIYAYLLHRGIKIRRMNGFLRITSGSAEENETLLYELNNYMKE